MRTEPHRMDNLTIPSYHLSTSRGRSVPSLGPSLCQ